MTDTHYLYYLMGFQNREVFPETEVPSEFQNIWKKYLIFWNLEYLPKV